MAFEGYPVPGDAWYLKIETAYGTNPDAPNNLYETEANRFYVVEGGSLNSWKPSMKRRSGASTHRAGFRPAQGEVTADGAFTVELDFKTVDATTFPNARGALEGLCGFTKAHTSNADYAGPNKTADGGTNDEIQTYTFSDRLAKDGTSATLEKVEFEEGAAPDGTLQEVNGARADWTLNLVMDEVITMDLDVQGLANEPASVSTPATGHTLPAVRPIVYKGAHGISLYDVASSTVFGAGTVAAPYIGVGNTSNDANVEVLGISLSGNRNLMADKAPGPATGIKRIRHAPSEPFTGSLVLEQTDFVNDWDLVDWINKGQVLRLTVLIQDSTTTGDFWELNLSFVVMDLSYSVEDSRRVVELSIESAYPDSSSDGGGLDPANVLTMKWITVVAA